MDDVRIEAAAKALHGCSLSILPLDEAPGTYRREQMRRAEAVIDAADAVDPLRNPRVVTTEEELDALPFRTIISDGIGRAFQRWNLAGWQKAGPSIAAHSPRLPATILYAPEPRP